MKSGTAELTIFLLSVIRLILPSVLLPATTALATVTPHGRERGISAGANVVMPIMSPDVKAIPAVCPAMVNPTESASMEVAIP